MVREVVDQGCYMKDIVYSLMRQDSMIVFLPRYVLNLVSIASEKLVLMCD